VLLSVGDKNPQISLSRGVVISFFSMSLDPVAYLSTCWALVSSYSRESVPFP